MQSQSSEIAARTFNGRLSDSSVNIETPTVGTSVGWFVAHQNDKSVFVRIEMLNMQAQWPPALQRRHRRGTAVDLCDRLWMTPASGGYGLSAEA